MSLPSSSTSPPTTPPRLGKANRPPSSPLRPNSPGAPSPTPTPPPANIPAGLTSPKNQPGSLPSGSGSHLERSKSSKTRARDLLRKHYGLGAGPPPPSGRPMDPMDLDSPAFDAKSYYEQLITTSSLTTLLKKENELLHDMRELDSDRQSLVYNHHHELIAATDTISAMKTRAESLDAELDLLKVAFSEISRLSAEVSIEQHSPDPSRSPGAEHR
ncbi:uncharacterized protein STEHIDRAFT_48474 [Stereum hirsutum FP-91666 SS1]|uniref:uncharacterized protein n=1 Tax=Stereum hirsutum (strain FP-91666) TaxID=721885 RepID=UPI000440C281|nr:uncharacterized protein STEHIDRAFT_48474 [Stereum hirsutum FP-91666 SS1]EIM91319.1 hypothetical protein STEHIDRAFT_48474 [Stereum hirsutum FP-91666 SS1]